MSKSFINSSNIHDIFALVNSNNSCSVFNVVIYSSGDVDFPPISLFMWLKLAFVFINSSLHTCIDVYKKLYGSHEKLMVIDPSLLSYDISIYGGMGSTPIAER